MNRLVTLVGVLLLMLGMFPMHIAIALTPEATPSASPVAGDSDWQVTDAREIEVDGKPLALSPDGQWLAGVGPGGDSICVWDVEILIPTCAGEDLVIAQLAITPPPIWAPDSSAVAFVEGDVARVLPMDVYVFDVATRNLTNLTNTGDDDGGPLYVGPAWTSDSERVVFAVNYGFGEGYPDGIVHVDRSGGELVEVPLPDWDREFEILEPVFVDMNDNVFVTIDSNANIGGVWRLGLDGADPEQLLTSGDNAPVDHPVIASVSWDGQYLSIFSLTGFRMLRADGTFFLLDTGSRALTVLETEETDFQLVVFGPDGRTGLVSRRIDGSDRLVTIDLVSQAAKEVANSPADMYWLRYMPSWANDNTVFIPEGGEDGVLLTLEQAP